MHMCILCLHTFVQLRTAQLCVYTHTHLISCAARGDWLAVEWWCAGVSQGSVKGELSLGYVLWLCSFVGITLETCTYIRVYATCYAPCPYWCSLQIACWTDVCVCCVCVQCKKSYHDLEKVTAEARQKYNDVETRCGVTMRACVRVCIRGVVCNKCVAVHSVWW